MKTMISISLIAANLFYSSAMGEEVLKIGGVGSSLGSMRIIAAAFEKSHPHVKIDILPSLGSTGGTRAVLSGAIDIGLSGRSMNDDERQQGAVETEYAKSPFVFVTNSISAVTDLKIHELAEIYEGKRQAWPDGSRVRLVLRPAADVDTSMLENISPEMGRAVKIALSRSGMIVAITNQESDEAVEKIPGSLGTSTLTQVISEKRKLKILALDGVMPTVRNLSRGSYPLVKRFFIVTKPKPSALAQRFIDFLRTREGRKILEETGNIALAGTGGR
ncbi:MAG: substrate-binding domain-containing protein [Nitrospirota bacterium]